MTKENIKMEAVDVREIAAEEMCKTLLESLVLQIKMLKKPWPKLTKAEQDDIIEALRRNVLTATTSAVRLISAAGAISVAGTLEQVTIKDGVKAQIVVGKNAENLPELFDAVSEEVLIVCAGNPVYDKNIDMVQGDDDQNPLDLGDEPVSGDMSMIEQ